MDSFSYERNGWGPNHSRHNETDFYNYGRNGNDHYLQQRNGTDPGYIPFGVAPFRSSRLDPYGYRRNNLEPVTNRHNENGFQPTFLHNGGYRRQAPPTTPFSPHLLNGRPTALDVTTFENHNNTNGYNNKDAVRGSVLSAHNIGYTVQVSGKCCGRKVDKNILFDVTGVFKQGLNAILGPTGSGKSSFLDVLAGRKESSRVTGQLLLDGKPVPNNFKCMVGYVVQDDVVMGTLSVRENVAFSAALRLPTKISASERKERVNQVIRELGLVKCADTKVGNEFFRGVSGGERKRCNIGMELIISPPVLFLDEPTTGLDANTARTVLTLLKSISQRGRTIIFSIHQPRYSIYKLFDNVMLLSGGQTIYHGPAVEALDFFSSLGYFCQDHDNPPDFFLDVMCSAYNNTIYDGLNIDKIVNPYDHTLAISHQDRLVEGFKNSDWNKRLQRQARAIFSQFTAQGGLNGERQDKVDYATSFAHQMVYVSGRTLKNIIRNPQTSVLTVLSALAFAIVISAIYWQLDEDPLKGFTDRGGVLFFVVIHQMFVNFAAYEVFYSERKIFIHENSSGFYRVSVHFFVKILFDVIPLRVVPIAIMSCITYFAVGLNPGTEHFFLFLLSLFSLTMAAAGLCFFLSCTVRVFAVGQLLLALCYIMMMLFGGFMINLGSIGVALNWAQYLSFFKYGMTSLYINEFRDRTFCSNTTCKDGNIFLKEQEMGYEEPWDYWKNHVALAAYAVILFLLTYIQLRRMKKTN